MTTPQILDEIRRVRHAMSAEVDHDPTKIVEYFASIQKRTSDRIINLADQGPRGRTKHCIEVADQPIPDGSSSSATRLNTAVLPLQQTHPRWNSHRIR